MTTRWGNSTVMWNAAPYVRAPLRNNLCVFWWDCKFSDYTIWNCLLHLQHCCVSYRWIFLSGYNFSNVFHCTAILCLQRIRAFKCRELNKISDRITDFFSCSCLYVDSSCWFAICKYFSKEFCAVRPVYEWKTSDKPWQWHAVVAGNWEINTRAIDSIIYTGFIWRTPNLTQLLQSRLVAGKY